MKPSNKNPATQAPKFKIPQSLLVVKTIHQTRLHTIHQTVVNTIHQTALSTIHQTTLPTIHQTALPTRPDKTVATKQPDGQLLLPLVWQETVAPPAGLV